MRNAPLEMAKTPRTGHRLNEKSPSLDPRAPGFRECMETSKRDFNCEQTFGVQKEKEYWIRRRTLHFRSTPFSIWYYSKLIKCYLSELNLETGCHTPSVKWKSQGKIAWESTFAMRDKWFQISGVKRHFIGNMCFNKGGKPTCAMYTPKSWVGSEMPPD